jgi:hypothetical protein
MSDYKVAERIALLSPPERNVFRRILRETGSIQQLRLYDILTKQLDAGLPADKKKAFAKVFETPWTRDKDYLIRNLFRLLHTGVENFLLGQQDEEALSIRNKFPLLRRMMQAGQHTAFRAEFDELLGCIQAAGDAEAEAGLLGIYSEFNLIRYAGNAGKLADSSEAMFSELELIRTHYRRQTEALYARHALAAWHTRKKGVSMLPMQNTGIEYGNDDVVNYFKRYSHTMQAEPVMQILLASQTLQQLEQVNSPLINRSKDQLDLNFVMASASLAMGNYTEARLLFERLLQLPGFTNYHARQNATEEFALCLCWLEQYIEAARLIENFTDSNLPLIYTLLLGNESAEAQKQLKSLQIHTAETMLAQLCINLVQQGLPNIVSELKKLRQSPAIKKSATPETKLLLSLIEKLAANDTPDTRNEITHELSEAIARPEIQQKFPLIWLRRHLGKSKQSNLRRL